MKKTWLPFVAILLLVIISLLVFLPMKEKKQAPERTDKENKELTWSMKMAKKYPYYQSSLEQRYLTYQKEHPELSDEEVLTYVNIGLDQPFYTSTKKAPFLNTNQLLVNKYYQVGEDYVPEHLEALSTSYAKAGISLVKEAKEALEEMIEAAKSEGLTLHVTSAYRSYHYQVNLYNNYVKQDGKTAADTYSARPGYSEHQTGLVVDLDNVRLPYTQFEESKEYPWMLENASKYGFILRFPKDKEEITGYQFESWHYRYVGKDLAPKIKASNLTFDEYYMRHFIQEEN